jgi:hypothetical protein
MSVIDIELAMKHLLAEPEDQLLVQAQLDAAEEAAMQFLQRRFFADQATLEIARVAVPARLLAARVVYEAAKLDADGFDDLGDQCRLREQARQRFGDALEAIDLDAYGLVINAAITAACLLKLGHLFANREEVITGTIATELPLASQSLLMPYRIRMGV